MNKVPSLGAWGQHDAQAAEVENKDFPPACSLESHPLSTTGVSHYLVPVDVVKSIQEHLHNFLDL